MQTLLDAPHQEEPARAQMLCIGKCIAQHEYLQRTTIYHLSFSGNSLIFPYPQKVL